MKMDVKSEYNFPGILIALFEYILFFYFFYNDFFV